MLPQRDAGPQDISSPSNPLESSGADRKGSGAGIFLPPHFVPQLFTKHPAHAKHPSCGRCVCDILPLVKETDDEQNNLRAVNES